jgi:hypothetical protein
MGMRVLIAAAGVLALIALQPASASDRLADDTAVTTVTKITKITTTPSGHTIVMAGTLLCDVG